MAKKPLHQLAYRSIRIEGGLVPAEELTRLTLLADPKGSEQTESQYRIAKGLKLRDEIARDFKIALTLWQDFLTLRQRQDVLAHEVTVREWLLPLMRDVLHFHDAARHPAIERAGHQYAIGHAGSGGRVPLVFAGFDQLLDVGAERFGETNPDTGRTHLKYHVKKQLVNFPPNRYTDANLAFIVPRVLELTYTAHDLWAWGQDLSAYDPRPAAEQGQPFTWNPERRAHLRAELDAYYACLYGLTRDELRYILDPKDVMGADYPSETFRVLMEREIRTYGEYRTRRLVLEAWDQQASMSPPERLASVSYSDHGMIRNPEEGRLAGLVTALVAERTKGCSLVEIQSVVAGLATAAHHLSPVDGPPLVALQDSLGFSDVALLLSRILPIVQRLEAVAVLMRSTRNGVPSFTRGPGTPPGDVIVLLEHSEAARLLWQAESRRLALEAEKGETAPAGPKATGT